MCLPNNPCLPSIHCHHSWIIIQMCEVQTAKSRSFQPHHVIHCSCSHSLLKFKGTQKAVQFSSDVSDDLQRWFLKVVLKIKEGPEKSGPQVSAAQQTRLVCSRTSAVLTLERKVSLRGHMVCDVILPPFRCEKASWWEIVHPKCRNFRVKQWNKLD